MPEFDAPVHLLVAHALRDKNPPVAAVDIEKLLEADMRQSE
jgi:hypothetical protein